MSVVDVLSHQPLSLRNDILKPGQVECHIYFYIRWFLDSHYHRWKSVDDQTDFNTSPRRQRRQFSSHRLRSLLFAFPPRSPRSSVQGFHLMQMHARSADLRHDSESPFKRPHPKHMHIYTWTPQNHWLAGILDEFCWPAHFSLCLLRLG